ncbi:hypothetical protein GCM10009661_62110 [Catellatospora chokoriensis]|uniref:amino acid adenylation domain-containing protein n=1 Tax=Catellatospora chokoriensis TaxID=310353 RepID=UPI0031CF8AC9
MSESTGDDFPFVRTRVVLVTGTVLGTLDGLPARLAALGLLPAGRGAAGALRIADLDVGGDRAQAAELGRQDAEASRLAAPDAADLSIRLLRAGQGDGVLVIAARSDRTTADRVLRATVDHLAGHDLTPPAGAPVTPSASDAATRWRTWPAGLPQIIELPTDVRRPSPLPVTRSALAVADVALVGADVAARLLAAFAVVLARYTGHHRQALAVRLPFRADTGGELCPVEVILDGVGTAGELVDAAGSWLRHARRLRPPRQAELTRGGLVPDGRRFPWAQFGIQLSDEAERRWTAGGVTAVVVEACDEPLDLLLDVTVAADGTASATMSWSSGVLDLTEACALRDSLESLLPEMSRCPGMPLADLRAVTAPQRARLAQVNAEAGHAPQEPLEVLFARRARLTPAAVAVRDETGREVTYQELLDLSGTLAARLTGAGVRPGDTVLLALPRSLGEVVAVLGVVRAGAAYAAVDPAWPDARLAAIAAAAHPAPVLALDADAARLAAMTSAPAVPVPTAGFARGPGAGPLELSPNRAAYVVFTSGSTGTPKGVSVPASAVVHLAHRPGFVDAGPGTRFLRLAPLSFDASTLELWAPLLNGGTIDVFPAGPVTPHELGGFLRERAVTTAWLTSGLFRLMAQQCPADFAGLRHLLTGGDVVSPEHVRALLRAHPGILVTNGYGPTENTTFTTVHHVDTAEDVEDPLPIGRPLPGTSVHVLDADGRLVPPGAVGELYTGGWGLADGYLDQPEQTAARFGRLSPDIPERLYRTGDMVRLDGRGRLRYLGRNDQQVKIRGYRIELDEVTRAVAEHDAVHDAVVAAVDGATGRRLLAAVTPPLPASVLDRVREHVSGLLPGYAVPSLWVSVAQFPLTQVGKVDARTLAALADGRTPGTTSAPPGTPPTVDVPGPAADPAQLAFVVMSQALGRTDIGPDDDFTVLGGDSLSLAAMLAALRNDHGRKVSARDFYLQPTLRRLGELLHAAPRATRVPEPIGARGGDHA